MAIQSQAQNRRHVYSFSVEVLLWLQQRLFLFEQTLLLRARHALGLQQSPWWGQWRSLLKNQCYDTAKIFNTMSFPSKCRKSPSGTLLERYQRFEINEVECRRRTGRCWLAQEVSCLWAAVLWPSSCSGCAASPTCLTSRQKIICKWCFLVALEYRYSGCGLNNKKQHHARLHAILKTKSVIQSDSKVLNTQINADEDKLVIYEEMRWFGKKI